MEEEIVTPLKAYMGMTLGLIVASTASTELALIASSFALSIGLGLSESKRWSKLWIRSHYNLIRVSDLCWRYKLSLFNLFRRWKGWVVMRKLTRWAHFQSYRFSYPFTMDGSPFQPIRLNQPRNFYILWLRFGSEIPLIGAHRISHNFRASSRLWNCCLRTNSFPLLEHLDTSSFWLLVSELMDLESHWLFVDALGISTSSSAITTNLEPDLNLFAEIS